MIASWEGTVGPQCICPTGGWKNKHLYKGDVYIYIEIHPFKQDMNIHQPYIHLI